ncbi:DUF1501 domain-containing protein [Luteimonas sp. SX5]|uniref:DUF1501 domain-containing protein n=1 Tax=Luteimonas galliterrae TaxID=2940486 RepID=A0ABT0ME51_9GAMM|nr:DUF1501 domain-containing protein [Luteimonas galliterrae]MCL1633146.1 DUF1501 domain-containing protein [Luteimonas galliterrae]
MPLSRRQFVSALGAGSLLTLWPRANAVASGEDTRLLVVLLRGGLDGLHALPPVADPAYARLRGALAPNDPLKLDGSFALHPSLKFMRELYGEKQLLPIVAVAPPYRQRSHFDAQDCLENGTAKPGGHNGWLNRCVAAMPGSEGLAIATVMPLILRGDGAATTWSPPLPQEVNPILLQKLQPLYAADPALAEAFSRAIQTEGTNEVAMGKGGKRAGPQLPQTMAAAARIMGKSDGPRIGFVEDSGWDTHGNQAGVLMRKLAELDNALRAYRDGMGAQWNRTAVLIVTEFGRTAAVNGTGGTDHGTGGVAFLAGGNVRGGRVAGDWPGLGAGDLNEGRDLRATGDLRAVFKGVLATQLRLSESALDTRVFPDSRGVKPFDGLFS